MSADCQGHTVAPMSSRGPLTRRDFDEVMRRAADLAAKDPDSAEDAFSDAEVVRIGREVGLPEQHVRRALAEHRAHGGGAGKGRGGGLRMLLLRDEVTASRTIERPRARIRRELDDFMVGGQLLQGVRRKDDLLQYRPAVDWVSRVARAASFRSRQHYVASSRLVEVKLERMGTDSTLVEIRVDPGIAANYRNWWVLAAGITGVAAGVGVGMSLPPSLFAVGAFLVTGVTTGVLTALVVSLLAGPGFRRRVADVQSEVEGVLDGLEKEKGLEPPPPAWRRWVRRHFHGVAREMMEKQAK